MRLGFTGTREGMTQKQRAVVYQVCERLRPSEVHHGDCIGADTDFHYIICDLDMRERNNQSHIRIHIHPPTSDKARSFLQGHFMHKTEPYLDRNERIVLASDILLATPKEATEQLRSGTWSTIRKAHRMRRLALVVLPDGKIEVYLGKTRNQHRTVARQV